MPGQPYGEAAQQLTWSETMFTLPQETSILLLFTYSNDKKQKTIKQHQQARTSVLNLKTAQTLSCCPPRPSPDADYAEALMMLSIYVNRVKHDVVIAVQKSGFAWALDRDNGSLAWSMVSLVPAAMT
ncbi:hypothetical protein LWI29_001306 [Acer saccharum]|uniref:Uncharacterized protein n=1 Tax=Acer saccharum TaxID=4024 RepID=A0AA39S2C0_ACESA|nr:hypothetical protein LWI29_001306 [Acer saccharum]